MLPGSPNPIRKTTVTRCVHILPAVDISYWEPNRSDQLTTTDPTSAVAGFHFLPPTPAQHHTIPKADSTLEFTWVPDLDSLHRMAPIEVTSNRWSTSPSLIFPSMDPLATSAWNEEKKVKVPQPETSFNWLTVSLFDSGLQHDQLESV